MFLGKRGFGGPLAAQALGRVGQTIANVLNSDSDWKCEFVFMFSMVAAEVFPGWTSVENEAPGIRRLSGWIESENDGKRGRTATPLRSARRLRFFIVSGGFFLDGLPWKTSSGCSSAALAFVRARGTRRRVVESVGYHTTTTCRCKWVGRHRCYRGSILWVLDRILLC